MQHTYYTQTNSPVGILSLVGSDDGLMRIDFETGKGDIRPEAGWMRSDQQFAEAVRQLNAYFEGELRSFDLRLAPQGTPFQESVWRELLQIPYGVTVTYAEIASRIGKPKAVRAVGAANGQNPLPIIIPCHRVIGSDGRLTGYGGGLSVKEFLLNLEHNTVLRGSLYY